MSDIPSEIFREILVRLPAESLFRLKSVCKEWLRIIDDPSFIKDHTNNQLYYHTLLLLLLRNKNAPAPLYSFSLDSLYFIRNKNAPAPLHSFSLDSLNFISGPQMIDASRINHTIRSRHRLLPPWFLTAFCNGLLLVSKFDIKSAWAICNPLTREFHELPQPNASVSRYYLTLCALGFGYDYMADDYKVVKIDKFASGINFVYQTLIYSLKSDSWRRIEDCPCCPCFDGAFLNGTLYWKSKSMDVIIALDLRTESYSQLPLPPVDRSELREQIDYVFHLDSLDGCLIYSLYYWRTHLLDGWVMKDNGVQKSWVKLFSLQRDYRDKEPRLLAYIKRKEQVVLQHDSGFLWFDIDNNSVKKFSIHGLPNITMTQNFHGSLVRLSDRDIGGKRMQTINRTDTRLKFCVRNVEEICCSDNKSCSEDLCRLCKEE